MSSVCFYFQVHQPYRLRPYGVFDIGATDQYFANEQNRRILERVADKCYRPMNALLLDLVRRHDGRFRFAFSVSGTALEQLSEYAPDVVDGFRHLADTGCVEFLAETYHHSLAFLFDRNEFDRQVTRHEDLIEQLFGRQPAVFRNTELIFNDELVVHVANRGFRAVLAEGADRILGWRSPNFVYRSAAAPELKVLLKNYRLSDDIAFRFGDTGWDRFPLKAETYAGWVEQVHGNGDTVNLFMDYETFGEHQWASTGIFDFMDRLPAEMLAHGDIDFATPSEVVARYPDVGQVEVPEYVSWADEARDVTAWLGNGLQWTAARQLYERVAGAGGVTEEQVEVLRRLTTSDHLYYMCTKWFEDGDVHAYFNPFESPYEAYISFMNVMRDLELRVGQSTSGSSASTDRAANTALTRPPGTSSGRGAPGSEKTA